MKRTSSELWGAGLFFLSIIILTQVGWTHSGQKLEVSPSLGNAAKPPIPGADEFAQELSDLALHLLNDEQAEILNRVLKHLTQSEQVRKGEVQDTSPLDADLNRTMADQLLISLTNGISDLIEFDFRQGVPKFDASTPIEIPEQSSLILLKVVTGEGDIQFRTKEVIFTFIGDNQGPLSLPIQKLGTTYYLLKLSEIPRGTNTFILDFRNEEDEKPSYWHGITLRTQPFGQFALEVVDENGEETPFLLRISAQPTGRLWEPASAVDLGPIMTKITGMKIYGPGKGITYYLPGNLRGPYWVMPHGFEMGLPPGKWDLLIYHGPEHHPVRETIEVKEGEWTRKKITLDRWIDMAEKGWYSGDDHVHARLLSSEDANNILTFAKASDIRVANILEMGNERRTWYPQRGFGPEFRVRDEETVLVPGQEDPRSYFGHIIGMNLQSMARDTSKYFLNDWVAEAIHEQGGLYGHTHVGQGGLGILRAMSVLVPYEVTDFNSIMQSALGTERYYPFLNLGFKMTASAGSDTPYGGAVGVVRVFAYLGEDEPFSADAWFNAIKRGRTFVTNGPMIDFRIGEAFPGDEIEVKENRPLKLHAKASGVPHISAPLSLQVIQGGEVIKELKSTDANQGSMEIEMEIESGFGSWVAVQATGLDGSQAHTTPIYIRREGYRFWNMDRVPEVIEARYKDLDEMDQYVTENEDLLMQKKIPHLDHFRRFAGEQAGEVRKRTKAARDQYKRLLNIHQEELQKRNSDN
ncbi:MAG: CehA/McbA family metallohydrolase [Candidatus Omnitrophica bacterium]|nr:CehA/McbA family metallohydrolase [Candidatus Omnitrophota bacterium]